MGFPISKNFFWAEMTKISKKSENRPSLSTQDVLSWWRCISYGLKANWHPLPWKTTVTFNSIFASVQIFVFRRVWLFFFFPPLDFNSFLWSKELSVVFSKSSNWKIVLSWLCERVVPGLWGFGYWCELYAVFTSSKTIIFSTQYFQLKINWKKSVFQIWWMEVVLLADAGEKTSCDPICYIPSLDHGAVKQSLHPSPDCQSTERSKL